MSYFPLILEKLQKRITYQIRQNWFWLSKNWCTHSKFTHRGVFWDKPDLNLPSSRLGSGWAMKKLGSFRPVGSVHCRFVSFIANLDLFRLGGLTISSFQALKIACEVHELDQLGFELVEAQLSNFLMSRLILLTTLLTYMNNENVEFTNQCWECTNQFPFGVHC